MGTEQNVTAGVPERDGRRFAGRGFIKGENRRIRLKGVFVEQDGEVRVASVRNERVGDVRNVVTGFLRELLRQVAAMICV